MSDTSDKDRPTSSSASDASSSSSSSTSPPKPREPFFETVRRISDYQFSTLLHSLIGLPSSLTPPATSGWILDDDLDPSQTPRPRTVRSGSDSIVDEVRKLRDDEERKGGGGDGGGGGGGGGMGISRAVSGGDSSSGGSSSSLAVSSSNASSKREGIAPALGDLFAFPLPAGMLRGFEELYRELLRPLATNAAIERPYTTGQSTTTTAAANASTETELDYYSFFEQQFREQRPSARSQDPSSQQQPRRLVESFSEVRSFRGTDGVTKTRRVEMKKFSDGTVEQKEGERTILPPNKENNRIRE